MAISAALDILVAILDSGDRIAKPTSRMVWQPLIIINSTAAKGYDCAFCDKSTKIGTLVVLYI